jgi:serine/threonine protein phosphatase PrpC
VIPAERAHLRIAASTHAGMSGKNNEDRYAVSAYRLEGSPSLPSVLAVVCDGIGGHRAGEVAAEIAVETISQGVAQSDASQPIETLRTVIQEASQKILEQAQEDHGKHGMGSTCACAWVIDKRLYIAYVGDSRIYLLRDGKIHQLSNDHTWVQEAIDVGLISPEQAREHPNAHVIRRHLGSQQPVEPDTRLRLAPDENNEQMEAHQGMELLPGDQLVLCSDGLTDLVNPDEILQALQGKDQQEALKELTQLANQRGGHDNITIISMRVPPGGLDSTPTIPIPRRKLFRSQRRKAIVGWSCLVAALLVVLLVSGLIAGYLFLSSSASNATLTPTLTSATVTVTSMPSAETPFTTPPTSAPAQATPTRPQASPPPAGSPPAQSAPTLTPWPTNTIGP